jgi:dienelactone hydrolase
MIRTLRKTALCVPMAAIALAVSSAYAAPVGPSDSSFYNVPAVAGAHGDLIQYRPTTAKLGAGAPATKAWNVLYQSTDSLGVANAVSGTVLVPTAAWSGTGTRPVMLYAVGTHGLAAGCSPSRQFEKGTDYEAANITAALKAGYAVLVSDYAGYLNGQKATYLAGKSQGQATLDIFKAATSIPSVGFTAASKVAIWGFSQGGQTAAWAGELLSTYAPAMKVVGVAAGGIPGDFPATAPYLDGNIGFAFLASAVSGLGTQYPKTIGKNFDLLASADGKVAIAKLESQCVFEALFSLQDKTLASFTVDPTFTLDDILGVPAVADTLALQNLGANKIPVPLYQFHGQADELVPLGQDIALKKAYCALGTDVTFELYPSEHIVTLFQAAPTVISWLGDRLAGKATANTCANNATPPASTANPGGGNFVVSLKSWPLAATIGLKTLGQTVVLPAASTFTAETDITAKTLKGSLSVPDFRAPLKIIGIAAQIGLRVTPVGDTSGSASVDNAGLLHVHGEANADVIVTSVFGIPFGTCKTVSPVKFPLNFDGPVSSLGNGGLSFAGTTTFPQIKGCGISAIISALMSGTGQTYTFAVAPPAQTKY